MKNTSHFLPQIQVGDEMGHCRRVIEEIKFIFKPFWAIVKTSQMSTPNSLLPAATKLWPRLYFYTCLSFCSQGDAIPACIAGGIPACLAAGGVLSQHALQVVSQHALQQVLGGCLVWGWPSGLVAFWYGLLGAEGYNRRPPHQKAITEDHFQPEGHLQSEGHQTRRHHTRRA